LSEINTDLILAHPMPPGAVHTNNNTDAGGEFSGGFVRLAGLIE